MYTMRPMFICHHLVTDILYGINSIQTSCLLTERKITERRLLMDLTLEYLNIFANIAKALFKQWEKIEDVANAFIASFQKVSLELIKKM